MKNIPGCPLYADLLKEYNMYIREVFFLKTIFPFSSQVTRFIMKNSTKFAVAIHTILLFALDDKNHGKEKVSSKNVALSVNTNPVVIRRITGLLKKSGLLDIKPGLSGAVLTRKPCDISLGDIYAAVKAEEESIFKLHENTNVSCPVGSKINIVLRKKLAKVETTPEHELSQIFLSDVIKSVLRQTRQDGRKAR
jgi:DNA-binding IscR family transcriptional regulator